MIRQKIEKRRFFSKKEKEAILSKSGGRCCYCGKKLQLETMTVDHFIPLAQGGTNREDNLLPACSSCNRVKDSMVFNAKDKCKHLKSKPLAKLQSYVDSYYKSVYWVSKNNIFSEDTLSCIANYDTMKRDGTIFSIKKKSYFQKAFYRDLDEIYHFVIKYNKKYNVDCFDKELIAAMSDRFDNGAFYYLKDSVGNLQIVVVLSVRKTEDDDGCCLYSEVYINPDLNLPVIPNKQVVPYSHKNALTHYYSDILLVFYNSIVRQFNEDVMIRVILSVVSEDRSLKAIVSSISSTSYNELEGMEGERILVPISLSSSNLSKSLNIFNADINEDKVNEYIERGEKLLLQHLQETEEMNSVLLPVSSQSKNFIVQVLNRFIDSFIRKLHTESIAVNPSKGEGYIKLYLDYGTLKTIKVVTDEFYAVKSKICILYNKDSTIESYRVHKKNINCDYWYVSENTIDFVATELANFIFSEKEIMREYEGKATYNRRVFKNKMSNPHFFETVKGKSKYKLEV